uniref:ODAD1 central coiled coil region domain-containing protein n=1 Tax=Phaeomonas parva TaxID=124430 RepID=A0A7S1XXH8_9STRA|mmetsp:Transcript_41418/g.129713  ORF Transcript_41418/g.129713 Transcript_41418/m.129713 type:complete len:588 (+) Transcript_41418:415-2178(+)
MAATMESRAEDFQQLQREYRHMELNRKAYADESHQIMRKQQQNIDKLRRENETLKSSMSLEMRQRTQPLSDAQNEKVMRLQDEADAYTEANEKEKRNIMVLREQITHMRQEILRQRKAMGGVNAARENQAMVQKQVRILENRLDKALVKFNEVLAKNKVLRQTIDDLRRERVVFDNIYRKLEKDLEEKKRQMANIIELSNLSYEQRDNFQMEIAAIEQANRKEQQDFEDQMMELDHMMDSILSVEPMRRSRRRGRNGASTNDLRHEGSRTDLGNSGPMGLDDSNRMLSQEDEAKLQEEMNQGTRQLMKDREAAETSMKRVQNFEEAFNKIRAATGIQDVDELVRTFIKNEDQNFSLFNYVNEQTNEIEKLEEQIQGLREEEARYAQESGDDANQHKAILKDLEARLQATESMAEKYEHKCVDASATLERLKRGIQSTFKNIECGSMSDMISESTVTETNMMTFLGMCEQRANEILQAYAFVQRRDQERTAKMAQEDMEAEMDAAAQGAAERAAQEGTTSMMQMLGTGPMTPMGHDLIHVNPPKLEDYSEVDVDGDDDDERPLTRDELKARTQNSISKRGGQKSRRRL